ncbi:Phosphoglycerate mutase family protein [Pyrenophora tritici-repentis]|nr:Phosphoglycerate mutase family protein [Pyrenophora tritici-repentis]
MPPKVHLVRHAQGEHNATRDYTIRDAVLTAKGKEQCATLRSAFAHHDEIDVVFASPLRRTIQTAALSFGPVLSRQEVSFALLPALQEVSNIACDVGIADIGADVHKFLPDLFTPGELDFDVGKVDASAVTEGWNSKVGRSPDMMSVCMLTKTCLQQGYWAYEKTAISKRAAELRNWLYQRPEAQVIIVTHGAFAHFLTEDWDVEDPMLGTAFKNCEHRVYVFSPGSTAKEAHLEETWESRRKRGGPEVEKDPHVVEEFLKTAA